MDGHNSNGRDSDEASSPTSQYLSSLIAATDSGPGIDYGGSLTSDFFSGFFPMRPSHTRSISSGNSPHQSGTQTSPTNPQPPSPTSNRHPLSQIAINNARPPPPPLQRSSDEHHTQKTQPSILRGSRISPSQWESRRAKIRELFIDNDNSLDETMKIMEKNYSFSPSRKQYITKLKQWGFKKNISAADAGWMLKKAESRKRQGRGTEFRVGGQLWPMERIERSAKRAKSEGTATIVIDAETPPEIGYSTPGKDDPHLHKPASPERWTPSLAFHVAKPTFPHLRWDGKTKADLEHIYQEAQGFARLGNFGDADDRYLRALAGYEALLSPTHEDTIEVAYELAEFYARNDRMNDADKVIDWMGDKHMERWPIGHKSIRAHIIRVADKLYSWSRADDAVSMLSHAANAYEKSFQPQFPDNTLLGNLHVHGPFQPMRNERRKSVHFGRVEPPQQEDEDISAPINYKVILAMARAQAEEEEAEALLLSFLEQCEKQPEKLSVQILEARVVLVDLYKLLEKPEKVGGALSQIDKAFWAVFNSNAKMTELLLESAVEAITSLVKARRYSEAEPLLGRIESELVKAFGEDGEVTISILIQIGKMYQTQNRWDDARPRFEQALAASMSAYGMESTLTLRLEETLEKKAYILHTRRFEEPCQLSISTSPRFRSFGYGIGYGNTAMFFEALIHSHFH